MNALRLPRVARDHSPAYTEDAPLLAVELGLLKLFWWIVPTSFSSSLCAVSRISAAGTSGDVAHLEADECWPSTCSTIPIPWRSAVAAAQCSISSTNSSRSPSSDYGQAALEARSRSSSGSSGARSGGVTVSQTSLAGRLKEVLDRAALRRAPPDVVVHLGWLQFRRLLLFGMPRSRAKAISPRVPSAKPRTGVMYFSSGLSDATVVSMPTWSLPLPVQPGPGSCRSRSLRAPSRPRASRSAGRPEPRPQRHGRRPGGRWP